MIHQLMALYDSKARAFWTPFCATHVEVGIRGVQGAALNQGKSAIADHPQDFTLYHLGTFDDELGQVTQFAQAVNIGLVSNLVAKLVDQRRELADLDRVRRELEAETITHTKGRP